MMHRFDGGIPQIFLLAAASLFALNVSALLAEIGVLGGGSAWGAIALIALVVLGIAFIYRQQFPLTVLWYLGLGILGFAIGLGIHKFLLGGD